MTTTNGAMTASAMGPDGTVYIAFVEPARQLGRTIYFTRHTIGAPTLPGPAQVVYIDADCEANPNTCPRTQEPPTIAFVALPDGGGIVHVGWSLETPSGIPALYLSAYDVQARSPVMFYVNQTTRQWTVDFADGGPNDVGRFSSLVYDYVSDEFHMAYYDATNGDLKLATRALDP